jgi:hypothetical protein
VLFFFNSRNYSNLFEILHKSSTNKKTDQLLEFLYWKKIFNKMSHQEIVEHVTTPKVVHCLEELKTKVNFLIYLSNIN